LSGLNYYLSLSSFRPKLIKTIEHGFPRTVFILISIRSLKRTAKNNCETIDQSDILCRHIYVTD